jgi:hypothetical protein
MQRKDYYLLGILFLATLVIFYPAFSARYLYTDESVQLWSYKPGSGFYMFINQGRWITEWLFVWLFGAINTIDDVTYIRLFSLFGWLICLPVWYSILKRLVAAAPAYQYLPFFTCLYLVSSLPFGITIQWGSCLELFLANTSALVSGAVLYHGLRFTGNKFRVSPIHAFGGIAFGVIALFTYQTAIGCFLIPFLVHFISRDTTNKDKVMLAGVVFYFVIYVVYFPLYKGSILITHVTPFSRANIYIDPLNKLPFFFSHPLERSFWFNAIVYENSKLARALYKIMLLGWMVFAFIRFGKEYLKAIKYIVVVLAVFMLSYLPLLIIEENYASNRTMLALDICVWLVCIEMILYFIKKVWFLRIAGIAVACTLVITACYNFRYQFLKPVTEEYAAIKAYMQQHYHPGIKTLYVIMTPEDAFIKKYHIHMNMDEYGVPSTAFDWPAEYLPRQLVFEISGNRQTAEQLTIKHWPDKDSFSRSGDSITNSVLVVDLPDIINAENTSH